MTSTGTRLALTRCATPRVAVLQHGPHLGAEAALERRSLDRWAAGHPSRFTVADAEDGTYLDDVAAHRRVEGLAAMQACTDSLEGQIPPHRYEVVDPKVQLRGDVAVLTLRYHPGTDGTRLQAWKATSVYRRARNEWHRVHAHWSMDKEA